MKHNQISRNLTYILFIFSFIVVLLVSFYANSLISFSLRTMEYNIERRLLAASEWLARLVSIEELDQYRTAEDMELPSYKSLRERLLDFSHNADVLYAYYIRPLEDGFQFIIDNDSNEETRVGLDTPLFDAESDPWVASAMEGQAVCTGLGNYASDWEGLLSAYAPMFDLNGKIAAIAGVDIDDEFIVWARRMVSILTVVQIFAIVAIFVSGLICLINFRREAESAKEASSIKSQFLSRMSHEIRTPMNAIIGLSKLALREELSEKVRSYCADVNNAASNLLGIINDILDFSKIESGKMEILPAEYQFASLVNNVTSIIRMRLADSTIGFVTDIDKNIPACLIGDEVRVRQILLNLLSNAVKYTNEGHITLSLRMETPEEGNILLVATVTDTGIGIRKEDQEKLFHDFTRFDLDRTKNVEGTGLGLAIALSLCRAMGGNIAVQSEYGKGSVFTAIIPQGIKDSTPYAEVPEPVTDTHADVHFTVPDARILVVDDISINLIVAEGLLTAYQAQVDTVLSGTEAIELIKQRNYDIVFMDHMMPGMDGIEATSAIRTWEKEQRESGAGPHKQVPIIALTANAVSGMKEMFLEKGFSDFLAKPIDVSKMEEILLQWLPEEKKKEEGDAQLDN